MTTVGRAADIPVRKSITVNATVEHAFKVFTEGFDSWWPREHHIGKGKLERAVIETRLGGRCYGREADGSEWPWGTITAWEPPRRFTIAWQINADWKYEPDMSQAAEVVVEFTPETGGGTRVDLMHHRFDRMANGDKMREGVGGMGGWESLLGLFKARAEQNVELRS